MPLIFLLLIDLLMLQMKHYIPYLKERKEASKEHGSRH